jgi:hypothetical protein
VEYRCSDSVRSLLRTLGRQRQSRTGRSLASPAELDPCAAASPTDPSPCRALVRRAIPTPSADPSPCRRPRRCRCARPPPLPRPTCAPRVGASASPVTHYCLAPEPRPKPSPTTRDRVTRENVREVWIRNQSEKGKKIRRKGKRKGKGKEIYPCFVYFNIFGKIIKCKW